jgi:hypothetical protein
MIQTAREHWKMFIFIFIIVVVGTNANLLVYFLINKSINLPITHAQTVQPSVRFDIAAGKYSIGDTIAIQVLLSSPSQSVNTVAGEIAFPSDKLRLITISTKDSINQLWIPSAPYFSTTSSSVVFAGGIPNPGFAAVDGNILTLTFEALAPGTAHISINDLTVLANDGAGSSLDTASQPIDLILRENAVTAGKTYTIGDINHDEKTDLDDLSILLANWGMFKNSDSDLNGDGIVDTKDLSILLSKIK